MPKFLDTPKWYNTAGDELSGAGVYNFGEVTLASGEYTTTSTPDWGNVYHTLLVGFRSTTLGVSDPIILRSSYDDPTYYLETVAGTVTSGTIQLYGIYLV